MKRIQLTSKLNCYSSSSWRTKQRLLCLSLAGRRTRKQREAFKGFFLLFSFCFLFLVFIYKSGKQWIELRFSIHLCVLNLALLCATKLLLADKSCKTQLVAPFGLLCFALLVVFAFCALLACVGCANKNANNWTTEQLYLSANFKRYSK